jgi:chromosome segregation ATPase
MARWRGGMEARMLAVEADLNSLTISGASVDRTVTRIDERLESMRRELTESRDEIRKAASTIDRSRDDAVDELKATISTSAAAKVAWRFTRFQVTVGAVVAILAPVLSTIIVLAVTGQLK